MTIPIPFDTSTLRLLLFEVLGTLYGDPVRPDLATAIRLALGIPTLEPLTFAPQRSTPMPPDPTTSPPARPTCSGRQGCRAQPLYTMSPADSPGRQITVCADHLRSGILGIDGPNTRYFLLPLQRERHDFAWALDQLRQGGKVQRTDWTYPIQLVQPMPERFTTQRTACRFELVGTQTLLGNPWPPVWTPDAQDLLATDWEAA